MKKIILILSGSLITLLLLGYVVMYIWIDIDVQNNINVVKERYPGKAEEIDPQDGVVLSNIAHGYNLKGDMYNAIRYYEKMLNLEDPGAVEFAKQQIEALKTIVESA